MKKHRLLILSGCLIGLLTFNEAKAQQAGLSSITNSGKTWALLYQQRAAEYKALCFQAYNLAKLRLDAALKLRHAARMAGAASLPNESTANESISEIGCSSRQKCRIANSKFNEG